ncbi:MAG: hypothetical protein QOF41_1164 [Methylobacteriaceae bacterium]|jgi:hypothetical protein|nr:hypothetical protein [Methylobacteriaceae bacterium]
MVPRRPDPKRPWSQPLGDFVPKILDPAVARQGFGESALLLDWEEILGARIAAISEPVRLQWPPGGVKRDPMEPRPLAALVLRVEPGFGLEIQHLAGVLIDRVNAHLGWRCVRSLKIRQEKIERAPPRPKRAPEDLLARAKAEHQVRGIEEEPLRDALARLGARVLAFAKDATEQEK